MIVLDASAIIAIIQREAEQERFRRLVSEANRCVVSALTIFEASMVLYARRQNGGLKDVADFLDANDIEIMPFDETQARAAMDAFMSYGKGIHSTARLNLGDCASYALAKSLNAPLLFKGDDFAATDIIPAA